MHAQIMISLTTSPRFRVYSADRGRRLCEPAHATRVGSAVFSESSGLSAGPDPRSTLVVSISARDSSWSSALRRRWLAACSRGRPFRAPERLAGERGRLDALTVSRLHQGRKDMHEVRVSQPVPTAVRWTGGRWRPGRPRWRARCEGAAAGSLRGGLFGASRPRQPACGCVRGLRKRWARRRTAWPR
jgi:hypothetical protein